MNDIQKAAIEISGALRRSRVVTEFFEISDRRDGLFWHPFGSTNNRRDLEAVRDFRPDVIVIDHGARMLSTHSMQPSRWAGQR